MCFLFVLFWVSTLSSPGKPAAGLAALEPSFPPRGHPAGFGAQAKDDGGAVTSVGMRMLPFGASRAPASQAQELDAQQQPHVPNPRAGEMTGGEERLLF